MSVHAHISPFPAASSFFGRAPDCRSLFDEAPAPLLSIATDTCIQLANRHALRLLGYGSEDLLGRSVFHLYPETPAGKTRAKQVFRKFCGGAEIREQPIEMQSAAGARFWVALTVRPVRDAAGRIVASCSMLQTISARDSSGSHPLPFAEPQNPKPNQVALASAPSPPQMELDTILLRVPGSAALLRSDEIDWLQAAGNYVRVHASGKSWLLRATLNQLQAKLDPQHFARVHRSVIVNLNSIKELHPAAWGDWRIMLRDSVQLTASRHFWKKLAGRLQKLP